MGRLQDGRQVAPGVDRLEPEVFEPACLPLEDDDAIAGCAVAEQRSCPIEVDEVDAVGAQMVGQQRDKAVGIEFTGCQVPEIPVRALVPIAPRPRPVQHEQAETGKSGYELSKGPDVLLPDAARHDRMVTDRRSRLASGVWHSRVSSYLPSGNANT
jgi:hypothetical protein